MNCKPGDLAIIVTSCAAPEHIGKIIKLGAAINPGIAAWIIDGPPLAGHFWCVADRCVRPIRDQPGDDETLAWAGRPATVAPAR